MARKVEEFSMVNFIEEVCEEIGPRLGTYSQEKQAGLKVKAILEEKVDEVLLDDFICHPAAFLDFTQVAWGAILIGSIIFWWLPIISSVLFIYALTTYLFEQRYLKEYVDFFFPQRIGTNVVGKLKPAGEPRQIVICSAHHDSAYEFPLFAKFKSKFGLLAYFTASTIILSALATYVKFILDWFGASSLISNLSLFCLPLLCIIMTGYLAFKLHSKLVIPGANDNLSGVAVVLALAHEFTTQRLNNIELWFISFSCEECMRGSKRFVQMHYDELRTAKVINFDMVGKGEICVISAEPYYTTKHSFELAKEFQKATDLPIKVIHFGGTDAASFSKKGLQAISLVGLTPHNYPDTWHEMTDTPKIIESEKLNKTLQATIQYLKDLDSSLN